MSSQIKSWRHDVYTRGPPGRRCEHLYYNYLIYVHVCITSMITCADQMKYTYIVGNMLSSIQKDIICTSLVKIFSPTSVSVCYVMLLGNSFTCMCIINLCVVLSFKTTEDWVYCWCAVPRSSNKAIDGKGAGGLQNGMLFVMFTKCYYTCCLKPLQYL